MQLYPFEENYIHYKRETNVAFIVGAPKMEMYVCINDAPQ